MKKKKNITNYFEMKMLQQRQRGMNQNTKTYNKKI